jgi:hypothetical protein
MPGSAAPISSPGNGGTAVTAKGLRRCRMNRIPKPFVQLESRSWINRLRHVLLTMTSPFGTCRRARLALVGRLVERHGGSIALTRREDQGTTALLYL